MIKYDFYLKHTSLQFKRNFLIF